MLSSMNLLSPFCNSFSPVYPTPSVPICIIALSRVKYVDSKRACVINYRLPVETILVDSLWRTIIALRTTLV